MQVEDYDTASLTCLSASVAMENFGCAIYSESQLFYHNRTSTSLNKQNVAQVVAHEVRD